MTSAIRKFLALDRQRQRLFLEAWRTLGQVRLSLTSRPFKQMVGELELHRGPFVAPALEAEVLGEARRIGWAVRAAAMYTPWKSTCLVQVLAAQRMLEARLLPGAIYIGAAPGEEGMVRLDAHAWLKCGEAFITGEAGHERYTVVSAFSWP